MCIYILLVRVITTILCIEATSLFILNFYLPFPATPKWYRALFEFTLIPLLPLARSNGSFRLSVFQRKWLYWPLTRARRLLMLKAKLIAHNSRAECLYVHVKSGESITVPNLKDLPNKPSNDWIRYVVVSDTHLLHGDYDLPASDVLIHCGDLLVEDRGLNASNTTLGGGASIGGEQRWKILLDDFDDWLGRQQVSTISSQKQIFVTGGNHDQILKDLRPTAVNLLLRNGTYVEHGEIRVGLRKHIDTKDKVEKEMVNKMKKIDHEQHHQQRIFLSAASRKHSNHSKVGNFAFQYQTDKEANALWSAVPSDGSIDVMVTHGPPFGVRDGPAGTSNAGCSILLNYVTERIQPRVHVFGHWHAKPGAEKRGDLLFINAASVDFDHCSTNPPVVFDLQCQ